MEYKEYKYYCKNPNIKKMIMSLLKHKNYQCFDFVDSIGFWFQDNDNGVYVFVKGSYIDLSAVTKEVSLEELLIKILK